MRGIFQTLATAYAYSVDIEQFQDPANHDQILASLKALALNASELEMHGGGLDPSFEYLQRSLAKDARDAVHRFEQGQYMGAQFMLNKLTENCMMCHSRVKKGERMFDLGSAFVETTGIEKLPPVERVNIEIAARQFDLALATYEEIFGAADMTSERLSLVGAFEGYLKLCVGVVDDPQRAISTLEAFNKRADMPGSLKELVSGWIESLRTLDLAAAKGTELETARELIRGAKVQKRYAADRGSLVEFVAASTILHSYLQSHPTNDEEIAEAYYLLGVTESFISRSYWISETEFLLEKAIRQAPKSAIAKTAYAVLEEYTLAGYAGTSTVPPEVKASLAELKNLIED